jgi:hypothetical protein
MSCWAKRFGAGNTGFYFRARGGTTPTDKTTSEFGTSAAENVNVPTSWTKYEQSVAIPAGVTWAAPMLLNYSSNTGAGLYIDDVTWQKVVLTAHIGDGAIIAAKIGAAAVVAGKIATSAIVAGDAVIATAAIATAQIQDAAITNAKIGTAAVDSAKISDASIATADIGSAQITTALIADANITTAKIATVAITTALIADLAVTTAKIDDLQVTTLKIGNNAVTIPTTAYTDGSVTIGTGATSLQSVTFTATGAPVFVHACAAVTNSSGAADKYVWRIRKDGADFIVGNSVDIPNNNNQVLSFSCADTPSAGSHTYAFLMHCGGGALTATKRSMLTLECKK